MHTCCVPPVGPCFKNPEAGSATTMTAGGMPVALVLHPHLHHPSLASLEHDGGSLSTSRRTGAHRHFPRFGKQGNFPLATCPARLPCPSSSPVVRW